MRLEIPLDYQPIVGEEICVNISGRVTAVATDPMGIGMVMVTIDTDNIECEETSEESAPNYIGPMTRTRSHTIAATGSLPGSSS